MNQRMEMGHDPMAEIHGILGMMHTEGAMDEEGPFVDSLMMQIHQGKISPDEALKRLQIKMQSRNEYH